MKIHLRIINLGLLLLLASAPTLPAAAAETPAAAQTSDISLAGTTWSGTDSDGDHFSYTFEKDGTLAYLSAKEASRKATWKQFNTAVYFESNKRFSEGLGEIRDGKIEGKSWNIRNHVWFWKLSRQN